MLGLTGSRLFLLPRTLLDLCIGVLRHTSCFVRVILAQVPEFNKRVSTLLHVAGCKVAYGRLLR